MRNRVFAVLAIAVLAGGSLAYGTYNFMQSAPAPAATVPTQAVVVAAADLQIGTALKKDDLRVINFPQGTAPEGSFSEPTDLLPKTKQKSGPKGELLDELHAVAAQLSPKQIRDLIKGARSLEGS